MATFEEQLGSSSYYHHRSLVRAQLRSLRLKLYYDECRAMPDLSVEDPFVDIQGSDDSSLPQEICEESSAIGIHAFNHEEPEDLSIDHEEEEDAQDQVLVEPQHWKELAESMVEKNQGLQRQLHASHLMQMKCRQEMKHVLAEKCHAESVLSQKIQGLWTRNRELSKLLEVAQSQNRAMCSRAIQDKRKCDEQSAELDRLRAHDAQMKVQWKRQVRRWSVLQRMVVVAIPPATEDDEDDTEEEMDTIDDEDEEIDDLVVVPRIQLSMPEKQEERETWKKNPGIKAQDCRGEKHLAKSRKSNVLVSSRKTNTKSWT